MLVPIAGGCVDIGARRVERDGEVSTLTSLEARLVAFLAARPDTIVSEETLLHEVWGHARAGDTRAVSHTVYRLRKKLERDPGAPRHLFTERASGYRWLPLPEAAAAPPPAAVPAPLLPGPTGGLVGREAEIRGIEELFADGARAVALHGMGGVGKTALARVIVDRATAAGGTARFVDLSTARDEGELLATLAGALGVRVVTTDVLPMLRAAFFADGPVPVLLALDNLEQAAAAAATLCARILTVAPSVRLLLTSRVTLALPAATALHVAPLAVPAVPDADAPALALFLRVARRFVPGFSPDAAGLVAASTCVREVGGLPLGIELAAARLRVFPVHELADRLERATLPLADRATGRSPRQQSVAATVDWSWELLGEDDRVAFAALSAFAGVFTAEDAVAVLGGDGIDRLEALLDAGLVEPLAQGGARLLPPVRRYAAARLAERPEQERRVFAAHGAHVAARGTGVADDALARLRPDLDLAIDRALAAGDLVGAARLFHPLLGDLARRGPNPRALAIVRALWRHPAATPATRALLLAGPIEEPAALVEIPDAELDEALAACPPGTAAAELAAAAALSIRLTASRSPPALPDALALAERLRALGHLRTAARVTANVGVEQRRRGEWVAAAGTLGRAIAIAEQAGLTQDAAMFRASLTGVLGYLERPDDARAMGERARAAAALTGDRRTQAFAVGNVGFALVRSGRLEEALEAFEACVTFGARSGDPLVEASGLLNVGEVLRRLGRLGEAIVALERCRDHNDALGLSRGRVACRISLLEAHLDLGDVAAARVTLAELDALDPAPLRDPTFGAVVRGIRAALAGDVAGTLDAARTCPLPETTLDLARRAAWVAVATGDEAALAAAAGLRDAVLDQRPELRRLGWGRWPTG